MRRGSPVRRPPRLRPASPGGGAPRAPRHAASPWRSRPSRHIPPGTQDSTRDARRDDIGNERVVRTIELLAAGEIGDTILAIARADRQDVGVVSRRAAGVGELVADCDHRQHVVRPQGVDDGLEGRGETPQPERHAEILTPSDTIQSMPARMRSITCPPSITIALATWAPGATPKAPFWPARPAMVPAVGCRARRCRAAWLRDLVAQHVEFGEALDRPLERRMRAVDAGVEMADDDALAGEAGRPELWHLEGVNSPGRLHLLLAFER